MKISLCTIAYNEEKNLPALLADIEHQDYPHSELEIVLVDSMSEDHTRKIMLDFCRKASGFAAVKVIENRGGNQASGWNQAIMAAAGDAIIRVDSHASIPADFVRKNAEVLESAEYGVGSDAMEGNAAAGGKFHVWKQHCVLPA